MKTLFLLRHAKSSWDDPCLSDFERPLNARGLRSALFMGGLIRLRELIPDTILSSPAMRARTTAELVQQAGAFDGEIKFDHDIYEASPGNLRQAVAAIDDEFTTALVVGHNPGIEGFIRYLTGELEPMPTAALAVVGLAVDSWGEVGDGCGELRTVIKPRDEMD